MAIRTLQWSGAGTSPRESAAFEAEYFAGGGIVADSVPERELEETRWKAAQLAMLGPFAVSHAPWASPTESAHR